MTAFVNEACDQVSIRGGASARPPEMYVDIPGVTNISEYFSRPVILGTGPINSGPFPVLGWQADNTSIQTAVYNFSRIKGAFGWRATLVFRLQVIATPFQAGRLRMAFSPYEDGSIYMPSRHEHIAAVSQLPGVDLDIVEQTSCILKVPFIHALNYFLVKPASPASTEVLGTLSVFPYVGPCIAAGDTNPTYTLWFSLEDFETIGVAPYEYTAQMAPLPKGKASSSKEAAAIPGNLSNVLAAGSNLMGWAGGRIPFLSSIAGPSSWALRQAASIAASFGWSKPLVVAPVVRAIMTNNGFQQNCDGPDISSSLAMFAENSIEVLPGFAGSDIDEMSLDFIKGVYACIARGTLSTTNTREQLVYACQLSPNAMYFKSGIKSIGISTTFPIANSGASFYPSPVFGLAQTCRLWRGGFKFRVKMAKTKFHTGRLALGFMPTLPTANGTTVSIPTEVDKLQYTSMIWDLREGNTVEFEVPFMTNQSYLNFTSNYGAFFISVIEPLDAPATVAQTIDFVVEVAGAKDFEIAFPSEPPFCRSPADTLYIAQSGLAVASVPPDHPATVCIGEQILSVKQFISRGCVVGVTSVSGPDVYSGNDVLPTWTPNGAAPTALAGPRFDYFNYFQGFYGLQRGGVCFSAIANNTNSVLSAFLATSGPMVMSAPLVSENRAPLHVKVPFYSRFSRALVRPDFDGSAPLVNICTSKLASDTTSVRTAKFIRAADDFQLGYFLGAPPLAIPFNNTPVEGTDMYAFVANAH